MDYECTQAIPLSDYEEDTDDGRTDDKSPVGQLLVNCQKGFPETIFPLYEGDNVIGRQQDKVNIYIPLKAISKQHACIEIRGREVHFIYDMESRNKTRRGKMFLAPKVRYELKDGDTLLFGDVTTVYKKVLETKPDVAGSETGSETGSESMLINVSGIDSQNNSVGHPSDGQGTENVSRVRVEESFNDDDDAASDVSVDLLAATEAYGAGGIQLTVEETPISSRTKTIIDRGIITSIPESPLDVDATKPTLCVSASGDESFIFDAPTQAYRDPDDEDATPDAIFDCPTQAYGNDEDDGSTDDEAGIDLDGPTQAYPGGASPVFDGPTQAYGDQDEEGPTQAYPLEKETMEPTMAYSMDSVKVTKQKLKPTAMTKQESGGFALEKADDGDSEFDPSILEGPTQAYPGVVLSSQSTVSPSPSSQSTQLIRKDSEDPTQILSETSAADAPTQILSSPKHTDIPDTLIISSPKHGQDEISDTLIISSPERTAESKVPRGKKGMWPPRAGSCKDSEVATQILDPSPSPPKRKAKKVSIFSDQPTQVYGEDSDEGESEGRVYDDKPTQKYDDVEATQAYGDEEEAETKAYGDVEEAETQAYGDEAATQAYGDNAETQAYGDPGEEGETQAYGTDESRIPLEEMQTLAYGDGGGDSNEMETQAYGDNANELETQAYGDNANEMETQAYGDKADEKETQAYGDNANEMETQAYGDGVNDEGETQAYGFDVVPESEDDAGAPPTKKYEDFPESMEDIFEVDLKRESHVFRKPLDYSDDDETPPMTEEVDDELPDLDTDAPAVEQELDVPPEVVLQNEADESEIEGKKEGGLLAEKNEDELEEVLAGSSRRRGGGRNTGKEKSLEKPETVYKGKDTDTGVKDTKVGVKDTDGTVTVIEEHSRSGRSGRGSHCRNVSEDGPVLLDVKEFGLKEEQEPVAEAEDEPSRSKRGKAMKDNVEDPKLKRGKSKTAEEEDESEVPQSTERSRKGKAKVKPKESSAEPETPGKVIEEVVEEPMPNASKSKKLNAKVIDTEDSLEPVAPKSMSKRGKVISEASTSGVAHEEEEAEPVGRGRGRRRTTGKKQDDDADSVASETTGKEPSPVVAESKVTRGAMSRRSLPAEVVKPRGTPRRGRRSVAFTGLDDDTESVTSEVSEKDVQSAKGGRKGKGKAVSKLSPEKDAEDDKDSVASEASENDVPSTNKARRESRGKAALKLLSKKDETEDDKESVAAEISEIDVPSAKVVRKGRGKATKKLLPEKEEDKESVTSEVSERGVPSTKPGRKGRGKAATNLSPEKKEVADAVSGDVEETGKGKRSRRMSKKMLEAVEGAAEMDKAESESASKGRRGKQKKTEEADVTETKQTEDEEPVKSVRGKRGADNTKEEVCDASTSKRAKRGAKKHDDKVEEGKLVDNNEEEEESRVATTSKQSKRGSIKKEDIVEEEQAEPEPETTKSNRGRRPSRKTERPKEEVKDELETVSRGSRRQSDVKVPDVVVNKRGKRTTAEKVEVAGEDEDDTQRTSSSRGKKEDVKPVLPAPRGRGRRSHQPAAEDDETDSMSTISEASEVSTASSARGRRGKTKAVEQSPATTPKQGARGKRTASIESKEPAATPTRGKAAVERLTSPRLQNLPGEQHHKILFTGVVDDKGQKVVKDLGGTLVTGTDECTHLVTDRVRRTVKFLCCLGRGVPIISTDWLDKCAAAKRFVDDTPFIVKDAENEKKFGFKLLTSLEKADAHKLFTDYKIHVTKNVKPDPPSMKQIIMSAEGKYLPTMPKKGDEQTVIVSCDEDKRLCQAALNAGVHVVSNEFILTGLLQQSIDIEKYSLFSSEQASGSTAKKRPSQGTLGDSAKKRRR